MAKDFPHCSFVHDKKEEFKRSSCRWRAEAERVIFLLIISLYVFSFLSPNISKSRNLQISSRFSSHWNLDSNSQRDKLSSARVNLTNDKLHYTFQPSSNRKLCMERSFWTARNRKSKITRPMTDEESVWVRERERVNSKESRPRGWKIVGVADSVQSGDQSYGEFPEARGREIRIRFDRRTAEYARACSLGGNAGPVTSFK